MNLVLTGLVFFVTLASSPLARAFRADIGFWNEPCASNPTPGAKCRSGAIYAGSIGTSRYMTTPGDCTSSVTPACSGAVDSTLRDPPSIFFSNYCDDMTYGGFSDWVAPSHDELNMLLANRTSIGGFAVGWYSTRDVYWDIFGGGQIYTRQVEFNSGNWRWAEQTTQGYLRCVRSY